jgi:broad specificity phosphatase PhoE
VDEATPPRLFLMRHGETQWSLTGQHTGLTDLPLTPRGEEEASTLQARVKGVSFAHVFRSPRLRARQTCELAGLIEGSVEEPDLAEWNYGDYEGRRSVDIRADRPGWTIFRDGCPNGEMPDEIAARADRLIARLRALSGNIALFSHGEFGRVLALRWIDAPVLMGRNLALGTASLSIFGYEPRHPDTPVIALWNETAQGQL